MCQALYFIKQLSYGCSQSDFTYCRADKVLWQISLPHNSLANFCDSTGTYICCRHRGSDSMFLVKHQFDSCTSKLPKVVLLGKRRCKRHLLAGTATMPWHICLARFFFFLCSTVQVAVTGFMATPFQGWRKCWVLAVYFVLCMGCRCKGAAVSSVCLGTCGSSPWNSTKFFLSTFHLHFFLYAPFYFYGCMQFCIFSLHELELSIS